MLRRIVEITGEGKRLSLDRGFLAISNADGPLGSVPLDDIEAVIAASPLLAILVK
jgi:CRISP-associated protein Cas1